MIIIKIIIIYLIFILTRVFITLRWRQQYFKLDEKNPYTTYTYIIVLHTPLSHSTQRKSARFGNWQSVFLSKQKRMKGKTWIKDQKPEIRRRRGEGTSEEIIRTLNANLPFKRSVIRNKKYCHVHTYAIT